MDVAVTGTVGTGAVAGGTAVLYRALIEQSAAAEPRPESCGKDFGRPAELRVSSLEALG